MSQQPPPDDKLAKTDPAGASSVKETELEAILDKVPERFVRETLVAILREGTGPKYDPETFRIAAATLEKDNDNKLTFLMRKLEVEDGQHKREHELETKRYGSTINMLWPILIAAIVLVIGATGAGIYLAAFVDKTLGFSILSATLAGLFAYLGGLGTPRFWKSK